MDLGNKHRTVKGLIVIVSTLSFCIFSYCRTMAFENAANISVNQVKKINNMSTEKNGSMKKINDKNQSVNKEGEEVSKSNIAITEESEAKEKLKVASTNTKENLVSKAPVISNKKSEVSNVKDTKVAVNSDKAVKANNEQAALLALPANGRISSFFGYRKVTLNNGTVEAGIHKGIDIAVPMGTKIGAAMSGEVEFVGVQEGYGNVIILKHSNGLETLYGHCSKIEVNKGQKVNTGDEIGKAGSTGRSTGPHIHFEVRSNGAAVDPLKYLNTNVAQK